LSFTGARSRVVGERRTLHTSVGKVRATQKRAGYPADNRTRQACHQCGVL